MNQAQTKRRPNAGKKADSKKPKEGTICPPRYDSMPIVGIGASAGGLEAFKQLFTEMPERSGMAFVVVQHLDPKQSGMLPELLRRFTKMQVKQVEDGMKIEPNTIFVIPPNKDMSIIHGKLLLLEKTAQRGIRMPIDVFFRHLSDDQGERAIGMILSGMGTDGTLGVKAIKEKHGMVMVQDIASAKFSEMPQSAISTGVVDYIAPPDQLPEKLIAYVPRVVTIPSERPPKPAKEPPAMEKILTLVRERTGQDFSLYKRSMVYRRIERRMGVHHIDSINEYVQYLQKNEQEIMLLFKDLLIGVTNFFRDREAWESLKQEIMSKLLSNKEGGSMIRVWAPGCSTGEEAYSLAIVLKECLHATKQKRNITIQIFATDIDSDAIDIARQGTYPANIALDVSPDRLTRFFKEGDKYRVKKEIRDLIVFAPQNIIMDPPFTKLDILCCRNLLIYFTPELHKKLLPIFYNSLNPDGLLFLGPSESVSGFEDLFKAADSKWRIYS